jgi:hypothetical protein
MMENEDYSMKIPESVYIDSFEIKTLYDNTLLADRSRYGEYCERGMTITLDSNQSPQRMQLTYFHELVEAIVSIYHLSELNDDEEEQKQAMGIAIRTLMLQHKKFFCKKGE